jgi:predicted nucleic acid-binding protein
VADYARLDVIRIEPHHILDAIDVHLRYRLSFWDGLILAAAKSGGAAVLFTEDLSDGQVYDGVRVENPFEGAR